MVLKSVLFSTLIRRLFTVFSTLSGLTILQLSQARSTQNRETTVHNRGPRGEAKRTAVLRTGGPGVRCTRVPSKVCCGKVCHVTRLTIV